MKLRDIFENDMAPPNAVAHAVALAFAEAINIFATTNRANIISGILWAGAKWPYLDVTVKSKEAPYKLDNKMLDGIAEKFHLEQGALEMFMTPWLPEWQECKVSIGLSIACQLVLDKKVLIRTLMKLTDFELTVK